MKKLFAILIHLAIILQAGAQKNSDGSMTQYLYNEFAPGLVKMKNGSRNKAP